ncbi:MAG: CGGC domain-containing protein [Sphingomonadaceae bacterium]
MTKVGIIRCEVRAQQCAGYKCFPAVRDKRGPMAAYGDGAELVGFDTCGGCVLKDPSKTVERAVRMRDLGAQAIHLGNCLVTYCPWLDLFKESIAKETGLPVVLKTHE